MPKVIKLAQFCRCEVCGHPKAIKQIRQWNDRNVCTYCISSILSEEESF
ncbi:hypothetical protein [Paenibacillus wynnii]|nr:hypothetical protein [Paenibacillus wynnii]